MITVRGAAAVAALALGVSAWTPYAAAEPVDLGGQPVDGSTDSTVSTPLGAGLWTVQLGPQGQPQYFSYERQIEGSTVHVGVVGSPPTAEYDGFTIAATAAAADDPAGVDCGTGDVSSDTTYPQAAIGDEVVIGDEDDPADPCRTGGTIAVTIERYSTSATEELPLAIKIVEEAPDADVGEPVADDAELTYDIPEPVGPVDAPQGADSFDDAPAVDVSGGPVTIAAEVAEGTNLLWRVPLDWGDQLVVRADLPGVADGGPVDGVGAEIHVVQPSRDVFALTLSGDYYYGDYTEVAARLVAATYPLRFGNRYRDFEPTLPGDYWVQVSIEPAPEDRDPKGLSMDLTFAVTHSDGAAPTYKTAVLAQGGGAGPEGYSADTPYLVGDGEYAAAASGNPFSPESAEDVDDQWWEPRRGIGLGVGVVSLGCCAVGTLWLSRRRRLR